MVKPCRRQTSDNHIRISRGLDFFKIVLLDQMAERGEDMVKKLYQILRVR